MKSVYWRPKKVTSRATLMIGVFALAALLFVELMPRLKGSEQEKQQRKAMELASRCRTHILQLREQKGLELNKLFDPGATGLVGTAMSPITSKPGNLDSKQLSLHPQFPAAIVQMLNEAGVTAGDTVAIGWTGSFPGLNIALAAATEAIDVRTTVVASVTASQYGANEPNLTWLDMETSLCDAGLVRTRSLAASVGGPADRGAGMSEETHDLVKKAMERNGVRQLDAARLQESIDQRVLLSSAPIRPAVYINVGGGIASSGGRESVFPSGVSLRAPMGDGPDCVLARFAKQGIPVINLASPQSLAEKYRLARLAPEDADKVEPKPLASQPSRVSALIALAVVCGVMYMTILSDVGARWLTRFLAFVRRKPSLRAIAKQDGPQLMV